MKARPPRVTTVSKDGTLTRFRVINSPMPIAAQSANTEIIAEISGLNAIFAVGKNSILYTSSGSNSLASTVIISMNIHLRWL